MHPPSSQKYEGSPWLSKLMMNFDTWVQHYYQAWLVSVS